MSEPGEPRARPGPGRVASPCVRLCCLDERDTCLGCYRSLAEICAWAGADDGERVRILERARRRREAAGRGRP